MVPKVPWRVSVTTTIAATTRMKAIRPPRICSCRPVRRWPMSGRPPADFAAGAPAAGFAFGAEPPDLPNGSLSLSAMVFPLSQELAVAADDRQVDELGARMVGRRIADEEPAQVDVAHFLHLADEGFARQVLARTLEPFDEHLGDQESLDRAEVVVLEARFLRQLLVLLHHRHGGAPGIRHDLRDGHADAVLAERVRQRLAA